MSGLLEIFGRAIVVDTSDLIWHWLDERRQNRDEPVSLQERHLSHVIDLMSDSKYDAAQEQLRLYLFEHPACTLGRMAAASLSLRANNLVEATGELQSVYVRQPNNTLALYALGHCHERLGHQAEAIEFYQDCLKFKGYLQLPAQRLGAIYFKEGRLDDAIAEYEPLRHHYPDDISTLVILGYLYLATGQSAKAVETFNTAILIHPDNFVARDDAIDRMVMEGNFEEALDAVDLLLADQPERADLVAMRADIIAAMGATTDAIAQYQHAIRLCPDYLEATIKLGTNYLKMHAEQLAAQQFNRAIEINDKIVEAYVGLAAAQKLAAQESEARHTLTLAAAIQPNSAFLYAETAKLVLKAALEANLIPAPEDGFTLDQAIFDAHHRHLARFPQNPDLYYRLGLLQVNAGQPAQALESFDTALQINPTFTRARTKLALCLLEAGRDSEAMDHITPPPSYDRATLELYYRTGLLYCNRIKFASSIINLQHHLEASVTPDLDSTTNISIVLQNLGLADTVGLMWENLCQTAAHATAAAT